MSEEAMIAIQAIDYVEQDVYSLPTLANVPGAPTNFRDSPAGFGVTAFSLLEEFFWGTFWGWVIDRITQTNQRALAPVPEQDK